MKITKITSEVISLPNEFDKSDSLSVYMLLRNTGYFEAFDKVTEDVILNELKGYSGYIKHWLKWSENKRSSDGWFFVRRSTNDYEVGRLTSNGLNSEVFKFSDAARACSFYIKMEIESIRTMS